MSRPAKRRKLREPIVLPSARKAQAAQDGNAGNHPQDADQSRRHPQDDGASRYKPHDDSSSPTQHDDQGSRKPHDKNGNPAQRGATGSLLPPAESGMNNGHTAARPDADAPIGLPLGDGVRIVAAHPCGLYALEKPEGILSHPNKRSEQVRSLLNAPYSPDKEFYTIAGNTPDGSPQRLHLLHRLDSATSGLLLLADNEVVAARVREAFQQDTVRKTYLAVCAGSQLPRSGAKGRWTDRLQRERERDGAVLHVRSGSGQSACTEYVCLKSDVHTRPLSLLELHPLSGRTHQLRVHCAAHGLPIVGDGKYGDFRFNRAVAQATGMKRLFLHAARISLTFLHEGRQIHFAAETPQPASFETLLQSATHLAKTVSVASASRRRADGGR